MNQILNQCPCGAKEEYSSCCEPFIKGLSFPSTPEKLMRSRYSAYVKSEINYLLETTSPSKKHLYSYKDMFDWANSSIWKKLEIISTKNGNEDDLTGQVEFKAYYIQNSKDEIHHELSSFIRENGKWYFEQGVKPLNNNRKIGKNEFCPCGSGKKYKKCCEGLI